MVPQDIVLFNETLGYNIGYGLKEGAMVAGDGPYSGSEATNNSIEEKKKRRFEQIDEVVKLTKLDGLVRRLPQGYDTTVGERGVV